MLQNGHFHDCAAALEAKALENAELSVIAMSLSSLNALFALARGSGQVAGRRAAAPRARV
jgi:hypothetical protein